MPTAVQIRRPPWLEECIVAAAALIRWHAGPDAKLEAISLANPGYAKSEWGDRVYDPAYKKIEWK